MCMRFFVKKEFLLKMLIWVWKENICVLLFFMYICKGKERWGKGRKKWKRKGEMGCLNVKEN